MSLRVKCNLRDGGCQWEGELRELDKHLEKCSRERIPCPYAAVGCKAEFLKKKLDDHNAATDHLAMAVEKISLLTDRLDRVEGERRLPPVVFKMKEIDFHKENEIVWNSPPFYTHPRGYKLYLKVSFDEIVGWRIRNYISIHVCLMHGEYDEDLTWPFRGVIGFEILNQDEDSDHKEGEARFMQMRTSLKNKKVTAAEGRNDTGWGVEKIMCLYDEADDEDDGITHYLQHDNIYIRVSQVTVSDHNKPWLI